jgi:hypothetical protein
VDDPVLMVSKVMEDLLKALNMSHKIKNHVGIDIATATATDMVWDIAAAMVSKLGT